jgi:FO synthase
MEEMLKIIVLARLIFGAEMNIQAPYNLISACHNLFIRAGANDWGGISPVSPDAINPEKRWPKLDDLEKTTRKAGYRLRERLPVYPQFIRDEYLPHQIKALAMTLVDREGYVKERVK